MKNESSDNINNLWNFLWDTLEDHLEINLMDKLVRDIREPIRNTAAGVMKWVINESCVSKIASIKA